MSSRDNLGFLGVDFQYKLVHHFMDDKKFFRDTFEIIDSNVFTEVNLRKFVGGLKDYYERYDYVPSYSELEIELRSKTKNEQDLEFVLATIDKIKTTSCEGSESVKLKAHNFFKQQNMVKVHNRMGELLKVGDIERYNEIEEMIREAIWVGNRDEIGVKLRDNIGDVLVEDYRSVVPTGVGEIDKVLEGGLGKQELAVIIGGSGFGKALSVNELVCTTNGFKRMGDININDKVIGRDGKSHNILGIFPQGKRDIYTVKFSDGIEVDCDMEHLWNVNSLSQRKNKYKKKGITYHAPDNSYKTMTLKEIVENGLVIGKTNKRNFKIPMAEAVEFDEIETPSELLPYFMGAFIGDGCFKNMDITNADDFVIKKICGMVNVISIGSYNANTEVKRVNLSSSLKKHLLKFFTLNEKSYEKRIPKDYLYNTKQKRIELLNGLMDTDGTCQKNGCSCYNTKSKGLAEDVRFLVLSLGGYATVREKKASYYSKKYEKQIDCGIHYEVTITLCDPTIPIFTLERKQNRVSYRTKYKTQRYIDSVVFKGVEDAICIKVDAEDELFLTRDFVVTHNTTITTSFVNHAAKSGFKVVQIVFEDKEKQIQRKHISKITGIEARNLSKPENLGNVKEIIKSTTEFDENLIIKKFNTGEISPLKIKNYIKRLINTGFKPDMVIVDYFECLVPSKAMKDQWEAEARMMRELESTASEFDIAMWVATQGNRESMNGELVTLAKAGGSFKKIQIAHIVLTISRTPEDITNNIATLAVLKNRAGQTSLPIENVYFNNGTCTIDTSKANIFNSHDEYTASEEEKSADLMRELMEKRKKRQQGE